MNCINIKSGESFRTLLVSSAYDFPEHSGFSADGFEVSSGHEQAMHISLESNASADILALMMPGSDTKMDLRIELAGPGAACRLFGLYLCPDAEQASINVELVHKTHHCSSHQLFKGIVSGTSRAGFYGKIIVEPDAQVTEAYQENHSLLLSDAATPNIGALPVNWNGNISSEADLNSGEFPQPEMLPVQYEPET